MLRVRSFNFVISNLPGCTHYHFTNISFIKNFISFWFNICTEPAGSDLREKPGQNPISKMKGTGSPKKIRIRNRGLECVTVFGESSIPLT